MYLVACLQYILYVCVLAGCGSASVRYGTDGLAQFGTIIQTTYPVALKRD